VKLVDEFVLEQRLPETRATANLELGLALALRKDLAGSPPQETGSREDIMNRLKSASANGMTRPPWRNPPLRSSRGAPGACITP